MSSASDVDPGIDVHLFDGQEGLIHAGTLMLSYSGVGSAFQYAISGKVYQGSTATPVFTDGVLHQHELPEDALTP